MTGPAASSETVLTVVSLALTPFIEVMGAVPVGLALHMGAFEAALWTACGNSILVLVLLVLLEPLERIAWVRRLRRYTRLPPKLSRLLELYGLLAVAVFGPLTGMFVMLPAARLLGFQRRHLALAAISGSLVVSTVYASVMASLVQF